MNAALDRNRAAADPTRTGTAESPTATAAPTTDLRTLASSASSLIIDVAIPLGSYYALRNVFGCSLITSLGFSSVVPGLRAVYSMVRHHDFNALATLMLVVNVLGIVLSLTTGNPRVMLAKDSVVSSVIGIAILISVAAKRPMMSAALKPMMTKGDPAKTRAWDHLTEHDARFRAYESRFSLIWGSALLADCCARFIGAFTLPVATMVWLGTVILLSAIGFAIVVCGAASRPMEKMIEDEAAAGRTV